MKIGPRFVVPVLALAAIGIGFAAGAATSSSGRTGAAATTSTTAARATVATATTLAPTTTSTVPSSLISVVSCPTTYGVTGGSTGTALGQTIRVKLAPATASQLDFYSNDQTSVTPILGPRGWNCRAEVATDGSIGIDVFPAGESEPPNGPPPAGQGVHAISEGACQGCVYAAVCALVSGAAQQLGYTQGGLGCAARPAGETLDWIAGSATGNPPVHDVIGFGDPSSPPTNGVVLYDSPTGQVGGLASQESCTLPASEHQLCTAILDNFISRAWYMR